MTGFVIFLVYLYMWYTAFDFMLTVHLFGIVVALLVAVAA